MKKIVILVISLIILLTSCSVDPDNKGSTTPPEVCSDDPDNKDSTTPLEDRNYISSDVTYSEPTAQYAFRLNMDATETESAKYFFEESIENNEREACIEVTDKVLSNLTFEEIVPEIYIFTNDRYNYKNISDHKFYCSIQDWKSVEYITDVLLVVYGETTHYGTAFGYANYLSKNYNWNSYESKFSNPSVSDTLDLNYLCFNESFTTSNDIAIAKGIACAFVDA